MKSISIRGKRNIDSIEGEKKLYAQEWNVLGDEHISHENQIAMINKLYMGDDFEYNTTVKKELTKKINSYKAKTLKKELTTKINLSHLKIQLKNLYHQSYYATTVPKMLKFSTKT